ncbi:MAG: hypothetical protein OK439_04015 [Thaumarchaeota archaeon]|nr:hypothetical protein [Nitrososphaerota archaeon]
MIDILNLVIYGGGPSVIAFLIAYWTVKAGRKNQYRTEKTGIIAEVDYSR